jgi:hypothetical protein
MNAITNRKKTHTIVYSTKELLVATTLYPSRVAGASLDSLDTSRATDYSFMCVGNP